MNPLFEFLVEAKASEPGAATWLKLLPAGTFTLRDGRGPFDAGGKAQLQAIVERTTAALNTVEMMIDYDHQAVFAAVKGVGGRAEAAGWVRRLEARDDGIYGLVEWTVEASQKIAGKAYRYISPLFTSDKAGKVGRLLNAGLVNLPALDLEAVAASALLTEKDIDLGPIATLLGLPDSATLDDILAAVRKLQDQTTTAAAAVPDPSLWVPMDLFQGAIAEANSLRQGLSDRDAEEYVDRQITAGLIVPALAGWAVNLCKVNRPKFDEFLAATGSAVARTSFPFGPPTRQPTDFSVGRLDRIRQGSRNLLDEDQAIAANLGLTSEEFIAASAKTEKDNS